MRRTRLILLGLVAALAAACGGTTNATRPADASPSAPIQPTPLVSAAPVATGSASPVAPASIAPSIAPPVGPSGSGSPGSGVADLRSLLPDTLGGQTLVKTLFSGGDFEANPAAISEPLRRLLADLGRGLGDLTMAVANDPTGSTDITMTALRVRAVPAQTFFDAYVPLIRAAFPSSTVDETVLGSKTVLDMSLDGQGGTTFLYPHDDVLFIVTGTDRALVELAFASLP